MFAEQSKFPIRFPLILQNPMFLYHEHQEGYGSWSQVKYIEFQIPSKWDNSGEIVDHKSFFIFNEDIVGQFEVIQSQGLVRESQQSLYQHGSQDTYVQNNSLFQMILQKQKALYISTHYSQRAEILLPYTTDLHYSGSYNYLQKPPYQIDPPPDLKTSDYKYIFFKRTQGEDELLIDILAFSTNETKLEDRLTFLLQKLVYEVRYSQEGIKNQVQDAVQRIFIKVLKNLIRFVGKVLKITDYQNMIELVYIVLVNRKDEFHNLFTMKEENPLFCKKLKILKRDITAIVYKVMISEGLFPIHCEINTMDDSYLKLKFLSLFTDSEILPWSPKFHASLALANFHYSFTPNDLFNLRLLHKRKYREKYKYVQMRVLDFFPLDQWITQISKFFEENLSEILEYISSYMDRETKFPSMRNEDNFKFSSQKSGLRDALLNSFQTQKLENTETELIPEQNLSQLNISQSLKLKQSLLQNTNDFQPKEIFHLGQSMIGKISNTNDDLEVKKKHLDIFKKLLKRSLKRVIQREKIYEIFIESPSMQKIKSSIADEFYRTYRFELESTDILNKFCSIITETELRSYSTLVNNCQTPVAAFIYLLNDTFRPFQESLNSRVKFLNTCKDAGYKFELEEQTISGRTRTRDLSDLQNVVSYSFQQSQNYDITQSQQQLQKPEKSNILSSKGLFLSEQELEKELGQYLKFASSSNLLQMGMHFVQPTILDHSLDYFGFYGDKLSNQFLKLVQNIDGDPDAFYDPNIKKSFFKRISMKDNSSTNLTPFEEEMQFNIQVLESQDKFFSNYQQNMKLYLYSYSQNVEDNQQNITQEINDILEASGERQLYCNHLRQIDQSLVRNPDNKPIHMHSMLIHYQNKIIQMKQREEKMASVRHTQQEIYMEACYLYYNSVRLQLSDKQRNNTLSYIGFILGKDLDGIHGEIPENVTLQTLV